MVIDGHSDNAYRRIREAMKSPDFSIDKIYEDYRARPENT